MKFAALTVLMILCASLSGRAQDDVPKDIARVPNTGSTIVSGQLFTTRGLGRGWGAGAEIEQILDNTGIVSVALPVAVQFSTDRDRTRGFSPYEDRYRAVHAAPAIRVHPFSAWRYGVFSIGVRGVVGLLHKTSETRISYGQPGGLSTSSSNRFFFSPGGEAAFSFRRPKGGVFGIFAAGGPVVSGGDGSYWQLGIRVGSVLRRTGEERVTL